MPQRRAGNHLRRLKGQPVRPPAVAGLDAPEPPEWLPAEAVLEWRRVVTACQAHPGWLQQVDRGVLTGYVLAWASLVEAGRDIAERGALVPARSSADKARRGALVKSPAVQIARDATAQLGGLAVQLGLTPDARGRISLPPPERDSSDLMTGWVDR